MISYFYKVHAMPVRLCDLIYFSNKISMRASKLNKLHNSYSTQTKYLF